MIKFLIAGRRKREDTQERYFYEWAIIHTALMLSNPSSMRRFRRYAQHFSIRGVGNEALVHPLSEMQWDSFADHVLDSFDDFVGCTRDDDYLQRMKPHVFGDSAFVLALVESRTVHENPGFRGGGVKLIHFLKRKPGITQARFDEHWSTAHAQLLLEHNRRSPLIRKYVQNRQLEVPQDNFAGSLFAAGQLDAYAGIEEFWFRDLDDLARLRQDPAWYDAIASSEADLVDPLGSFSMVTTERVVYDYTLGPRSSPKSAVLDPASLEAAVYAQGLSGWNVPTPVDD